MQYIQYTEQRLASSENPTRVKGLHHKRVDKLVRYSMSMIYE